MTDIDITIIAATTRDGGLGRRGELLYRIGADMKHFKSLTMGRPIIMGRKTYESFPGGPLPGRLNIVLTRGEMSLDEGAVVAHTPEEALRVAQEYAVAHPVDGVRRPEVMIIGGGEIYGMFMPVATRLEITEINAESPEDTDTWFPRRDEREWSADAGDMMSDPCSGVEYRFISAVRNG